VKKNQLITVLSAGVLVAILFFFGRTNPKKSITSVSNAPVKAPSGWSADTILSIAKRSLTPEQVSRINMLEHSISRGNVKQQQLEVYHQLSHFWKDSMRIFEPYAWYVAEGARLENSEKTLTFAAHLFLDDLQFDEQEDRRKWKALQAADLFERSLQINPGNDSSKVGLGACYLFGNISESPMKGTQLIREVADRDKSNVYAQMMLARGSVISGQLDKAIIRLQNVLSVEPANLTAMLMLADIYERTGDKRNAIKWYKESLKIESRKELHDEISKRIKELGK
jgi:tetratricopeptide (TPR) repeat protein